MEVTLIFTLLAISLVRVQASLPEDSMTDSNEELARFKRGSFVESILKNFPFFKHSFENENEKDTDEEKSDHSDPDGLPFLTTSSTFENPSSEEKKDNAKTTKKSEQKLLEDSVTSSLTPMPASVFLVNSHNKQSTGIGLIATSSNINASSLQHLITVSVAVNHTISAPTADNTVKSMMATSMMYSINSTRVQLQSTPLITNTSQYINMSTPLLASGNTSLTVGNVSLSVSPSILLNGTAHVASSPYLAPFSSSDFNDTIRSTIDGLKSSLPTTDDSTRPAINPNMANQSTSTGDQETEQVFLPVSKPPMVKTSGSLPTQESTVTVDSDILHKRFRIPVMIGNGEDRNVRFLYINIIIPIVSGIMGAMLITFGIMMFRCCRRRKLKKVRYFGGKPSPDLVGLDRMNLLSESSDDEYYH